MHDLNGACQYWSTTVEDSNQPQQAAPPIPCCSCRARSRVAGRQAWRGDVGDWGENTVPRSGDCEFSVCEALRHALHWQSPVLARIDRAMRNRFNRENSPSSSQSMGPTVRVSHVGTSQWSSFPPIPLATGSTDFKVRRWSQPSQHRACAATPQKGAGEIQP